MPRGRKGKPVVIENGTFGEWLDQKILESGRTIGEIANGIGVSRQTLTANRINKRLPHKATLVRYSVYFNVPYEELVKLVGEDTKE